MATFMGTSADETITPTLVSPSVDRSPVGAFPGDGPDTLQGGGGDEEPCRVGRVEGRQRGKSGLGLAVSYELVRAHVGKLTVESALGKGTTFHIWLRRTERPAVQVLAQLQDGRVVAAKEGHLMVTSFHPELTNDLRLHEYFVSLAERAKSEGATAVK